MTTCPVMKLPASEHSNSAGPTISSGWAARRMNAARCMDSTRSGAFARTMSVSTVPGANALTRIPRSANTAAIDRVIDMSPALAVHRGVRRDEEHRTAEVRAEGLLPRVHRQLSEGERERIGGVVHDNVESAEFLHGAVHE